MKKTGIPDRRSRWMVDTTDEGADLAEIERLYRRRLPEFRRVAAAIVGSRELARDVVQEAFASAVRKRASFRGEGPLEAWVWRILVNAAREQRRARVETPVEASPDHAAVNGDHEGEPDARVRVALALLPERQRLVVFLRYYADLDYRTIGEALDIEPGTVGATLHTAHERLQRLLEEVPR
jgi:RNA polymerase sigma-70 factor, ECF subfamily